MRDHLGIVDRQFAIHKLAAKRDLHAVEAELLSERDRLWIGSEMEIPIRDTDAKFASCRKNCTARKWPGGQTAEDMSDTELQILAGCGHWAPVERPKQVNYAMSLFTARNKKKTA